MGTEKEYPDRFREFFDGMFSFLLKVYLYFRVVCDCIIADISIHWPGEWS